MNPGQAVSALSILPVIFGVIYFRFSKDRLLPYFFTYCVLILLIEGLAIGLLYSGRQNLVVYNFFMLTSFLFSAAILWGEGFSYWKWYLAAGLPVVVGLHILGYNTFDAKYYLFVFSCMTVITMLALMHLVDYADTLFTNPRFWIYGGLLIYSSSTVILHVIPEFTVLGPRSAPVVDFYYYYKLFLSACTYIMFSIAFYVTARI